MRPSRLLCLLALLGFSAAHAADVVTVQGTLPEGLGTYRIERPAGWTPGGRLLVYNHGFSFTPVSDDRFPSTAPDADSRLALLEQGYALAAASYADRGWALFDIDAVILALMQQFRSTAGEPGEIVILGGSLGGLVSLKATEALVAAGTPVAGTLSLCPALGGARTIEQAFDLRLAYDAICPDAPLPRGSTPGMPWVLDPADIPEDISRFDDPDALLAIGSAANRVRQCTGMFQPGGLDTSAQRARKNQLKAFLGISSDDFLKTQLGYALFALSDVVQSPTKLGGRNPFDNRHAVYADPQVEANVQRVARDPLAAVEFGAVSDLTGRWGDTRVLVLHGARDELVIPEHLSVLRDLQRDDARPAVSVLVEETSPAHCGFSRDELNTALLALRNWIDHDVAPDAATLAAACNATGSGGRCAFASAEDVAPLASRLPPRRLQIDATGEHHTGTWFDPAFDGEGWVIEVLPGGVDATVTWYTYPQDDDAGEQRWIVGLGRISADGIHVANAYETRGPAFGQFDPSAVEYRPWGKLTFAFDRCGAPGNDNGLYGVGTLRYRGNDGSTGERQLRQLTADARTPEHCIAFSPPQPPHPLSRYSGSWFRGGDQAGEGLQLQVDGFLGVAVLVWYTYDPAGNPAWLLGTAPIGDTAVETLTFTLQRPRGARFGDALDPDDVQRPDWGQVELRFTGCTSAALRYVPGEAGWSAGDIALQRLTVPAGIAACDD